MVNRRREFGKVDLEISSSGLQEELNKSWRLNMSEASHSMSWEAGLEGKDSFPKVYRKLSFRYISIG